MTATLSQHSKLQKTRHVPSPHHKNTIEQARQLNFPINGHHPDFLIAYRGELTRERN